MLNRSDLLCHFHLCSTQKRRDFRASPWHCGQEPKEKELGRLRTKVEAFQGSSQLCGNKAAGRRWWEGRSRCLSAGQNGNNMIINWKRYRGGGERGRVVVHKVGESTPVTAFDSPINSLRHSQQDIYSIFTPCVPPNGSCIMFHTEGNYLLKILCTRGVKALIFCRCLGHSLQILWPKMRCAFLFYRVPLKLGWFVFEGQAEAIYLIH